MATHGGSLVNNKIMKTVIHSFAVIKIVKIIADKALRGIEKKEKRSWPAVDVINTSRMELEKKKDLNNYYRVKT